MHFFLHAVALREVTEQNHVFTFKQSTGLSFQRVIKTSSQQKLKEERINRGREKERMKSYMKTNGAQFAKKTNNFKQLIC